MSDRRRTSRRPRRPARAHRPGAWPEPRSAAGPTASGPVRRRRRGRHPARPRLPAAATAAAAGTCRGVAHRPAARAASATGCRSRASGPARCGSRWSRCCAGSRRSAGRSSRWACWLGGRRRTAGPSWLMIAAAALVLVLFCVLLAVGRTQVRHPDRGRPGPGHGGRAGDRSHRGHQRRPAAGCSRCSSSCRSASPRPASPCRRSRAGRRARGAVRRARPTGAASSRSGPATTVQGDPLGLVRRTLRWTDVTELFVHPRTVSLESRSAPACCATSRARRPRTCRCRDLAFHALREYQPGDDRRYIHWRSSAKPGRLLVRQFLDTRRSHLSLVVDADPELVRRRRGRRRDSPSRAAASLAVRAILDEQDTTVVLPRPAGLAHDGAR